MESAQATCANCGSASTDAFCAHCGQESRTLDTSIWKMTIEASKEVVGAESRLLRTIPLLFLRPGFVQADYLLGRRQRYVPPIRLFLVSVAAFFLFFRLSRNLSASYYGYEARNLNAYADAMTVALVVALPIVAGLLKLLYWKSRRPLVHHLAFSLYSGAQAVLWFLLLMSVAAMLRLAWGHYSAAPAWLPEFAYWLYLPGLIIVFAHFVLALRTTYGSGLPGSAFRGTVIVLGIALVFFYVIPRVLPALQRALT